MRSHPPRRRAARASCLLALVAALGAVERGSVTSCAPDRPALEAALAAAGAAPEPAGTAIGALIPGAAVAVIAADADRVGQLADHPREVEAFTAAGGWIIVSGLAPASLAAFERLVGVRHRLRPFRSERVALARPRHALAARLDERDAGMRDAHPWGNDILVDTEAWGHVVDLIDLAPFAQLPDFRFLGHADADIDHNPLNLVDGFGSGDSWKRVLAFYPSRSRLDFPLTFADEVELSAIEIEPSQIYPGLRRVEIALDDGAREPLTVGQGTARLAFSPPRRAKRVTVALVDVNGGGRDVVGIDDLRLIAARDETWQARVQPLTSIGVLVAYPRGAGGVLLCQLAFTDNPQPQTAQRRQRLLKGLLTACGAIVDRPAPPPPTAKPTPMTAPTPTASQGDPLPLGAAADQPLAEAAWLGDRSFAVPAGEITVGGIRFRTGDAPTAVIAGPGAPAAVVPVGRAVGSLHLLHALGGAATGTVGAYTVIYADGRRVDIPVVAGADVADARQGDPLGTSRAQRAWLARAGKAFAAPYARQWINPTPSVVVDRLELRAASSAPVALLAATTLPPVTR